MIVKKYLITALVGVFSISVLNGALIDFLNPRSKKAIYIAALSKMFGYKGQKYAHPGLDLGSNFEKSVAMVNLLKKTEKENCQKGC